MDIVNWEKNETVAVLTMTNGTNPQNLNFAKAMKQALTEIVSDQDIKSIVLTSSDEKNFSQGVDLEWLGGRMAENDTQAIKDFMNAMNDVFKTLLLCPVPIIAAINGHAFGNGAILACACDFRFMRSDRGYFCFPEVDLGIPFLPGMIAWVKKAIPYYKFQEMKYTGKRTSAPELEAHHIIEKACPDGDALMQETLTFARGFQKKRGIFGEMKKRMHKEIVTIMETEDGAFIDAMFLMVSD
jgi:enoyl-CoA hydratase/carnithine racemase